jgi:putative chitinase
MSAIVAYIDRAFLTAVAGPAPAPKKARQTEIIIATAAILPALLERYAINTADRINPFLAHLGHETDSFCTTREYASGAAYEGRRDLGNLQPGDGRRYPGRGEIQLTGRENARLFTIWMRKIDPTCPDFEAHPELLEEFPWAVWSAIYFWTVNSLNTLADRGDMIGLTKRINGGKNGLDDRERRLAISKRLLAAKAVTTPIAAEIVATRQKFPVLHRDIEGHADQVETLQRLLAKAGYYQLAIDGEFGAGTEGAVRTFQTRLKLLVDGLAGGSTFTALMTLLHLRKGAEPWTTAQ